jgi:hypothetical protein
MSSGKNGKTLFNEINDFLNVDKLIVFCYDIKFHSTWFNKDTYSKFGAIFNSIP